MKMVKKFSQIFSVALLWCMMSVVMVSAHSCKTNTSSCHHGTTVSEPCYYYCDGHSAHLHPNGVCPYASESLTSVVKLSCSSCTLAKGGCKTLSLTGTNATIAWSSSDEAVATVDNNGKVTAVGKGNTTITAMANGVKTSCTVQVDTPKISAKKMMLTAGDSCILKVSGTEQKISWSSSDKTVVSVDQDGCVYAQGLGEAIVTAKVGGVKYRCRVTVADDSL